MTPRDRRALAVGTVVMVVAVVALRGVPWSVRAYRDLTARTHQQVATLERARAAVRELEPLADSLARRATALVAEAPKLLSGRTEAEAAATLSATVTAGIERSGLRLLRLTPAAARAEGLFRPVAVRLEAEGDVRGLAHFLQAIESEAPVLTVRRIVVRAAEEGRRGAPLAVEAEIVGWHVQREAS